MKKVCLLGLFLLLPLAVLSIGVYAIQSPALCVEGDHYTDNNCASRCVNGEKVNIICCSSVETISQDTSCVKGQIFASAEMDKRCNTNQGYYCASQTINQTSGKDNTILYGLIVGIGIILLIVLVIILRRRK